MKKRTDLLIEEITYFIQTADLKVYAEDLKIHIYVDDDELLLSYGRKRHRLSVVEKDGAIFWLLDGKLKLNHYQKHDIQQMVELIIRYFL